MAAGGDGKAGLGGETAGDLRRGAGEAGGGGEDGDGTVGGAEGGSVSVVFVCLFLGVGGCGRMGLWGRLAMSG